MKSTITTASLALAFVFGSSSFAVAQAAAKPAAKITMAEARAIALRTQPGRVVASELEAEKGGSGLRYSFDIKVGAKTREVGVDAKTGAVLENIVEGKNPD